MDLKNNNNDNLRFVSKDQSIKAIFIWSIYFFAIFQFATRIREVFENFFLNDFLILAVGLVSSIIFIFVFIQKIEYSKIDNIVMYLTLLIVILSFIGLIALPILPYAHVPTSAMSLLNIEIHPMSIFYAFFYFISFSALSLYFYQISLSFNKFIRYNHLGKLLECLRIKFLIHESINIVVAALLYLLVSFLFYRFDSVFPSVILLGGIFLLYISLNPFYNHRNESGRLIISGDANKEAIDTIDNNKINNDNNDIIKENSKTLVKSVLMRFLKSFGFFILWAIYSGLIWVIVQRDFFLSGEYRERFMIIKYNLGIIFGLGIIILLNFILLKILNHREIKKEKEIMKTNKKQRGKSKILTIIQAIFYILLQILCVILYFMESNVCKDRYNIGFPLILGIALSTAIFELIFYIIHAKRVNVRIGVFLFCLTWFLGAWIMFIP
ncbi:MAG: hypothetical protein ACTSU2_10240 [Promethearchaeota archaeon]